MDNEFINIYITKIIDNVIALTKQQMILTTQLELLEKKGLDFDKQIKEKNEEIEKLKSELYDIRTKDNTSFSNAVNSLNQDILKKDQKLKEKDDLIKELQILIKELQTKISNLTVVSSSKGRKKPKISLEADTF